MAYSIYLMRNKEINDIQTPIIKRKFIHSVIETIKFTKSFEIVFPFSPFFQFVLQIHQGKVIVCSVYLFMELLTVCGRLFSFHFPFHFIRVAFLILFNCRSFVSVAVSGQINICGKCERFISRLRLQWK